MKTSSMKAVAVLLVLVLVLAQMHHQAHQPHRSLTFILLYFEIT
jgi:Na+/serine symporter